MGRHPAHPRGAPPAAIETIGVLGGSFNPPHVAHVALCREALSGGHVERVVVVPAYQHPFCKPLAPFHHRMAMARLAFEPFGSKVQVSDLEAGLGSISYTIDTLGALRCLHRHARFRLLIGADVLADLPKWKDVRCLLEWAPALVFPRVGHPVTKPPAGLLNIEMAGVQLPDVSSSNLRRQLTAGAETGDALPPAVLEYIREHGLYRSAV